LFFKNIRKINQISGTKQSTVGEPAGCIVALRTCPDSRKAYRGQQVGAGNKKTGNDKSFPVLILGSEN
jgi:hypothetical protein